MQLKYNNSEGIAEKIVIDPYKSEKVENYEDQLSNNFQYNSSNKVRSKLYKNDWAERPLTSKDYNTSSNDDEDNSIFIIIGVIFLLAIIGGC